MSYEVQAEKFLLRPKWIFSEAEVAFFLFLLLLIAGFL